MAEQLTRSASVPKPAEEPRVDFSDDTAPRKLGRYELIACIARGGMATVWTATHGGDHGFRRIVAIKLIRPEFATDASFRRMFLDEARLVSRLRHTNIVEVSDLGEESGVVFHVMPLIEGDALSGLLRRQAERGARMPVAVTVRILVDVLRGLHAAHELTDEHGARLDLVHRDVSPQNILIGADGVAKIADFGIAKAFGRVSEETEAGLFKGKLAYAAPEQVQRKALDRRTDVFSAGIVLWEALTGVRLFKGEDVLETVARLKSMHIDDPRKHVADLPESIVKVTLRALATSMDDRFQTAEEMADALEEASRAFPRAASAKDVAAVVLELVPDVLSRYRGSQRKVPAPTSGVQTAAPTIVDATPAEPSVAETVSSFATRKDETPRRGSRAIALGALSAVAIVGAIFVARATMHSASTKPSGAAATAVASDAPAPPTPSNAPADAPTSSAPLASVASEPSAAPAASAPRKRVVGPPPPAAPKAPSLKYRNPYDK